MMSRTFSISRGDSTPRQHEKHVDFFEENRYPVTLKSVFTLLSAANPFLQMLRDTVQLFSAARQSKATNSSPRRLALAVALGIVIGLIPKASLLAWFFVVVMMISTANLLVAFLVSFAVSWLAPLLDGFTHRLGAILLTDARLEPTWANLYDIPIVPWTQFNNTVVMGSLVVGLISFLPVYLLSESFFRKYGPVVSDWIYKRIGHTWFYQWLCPTDDDNTNGTNEKHGNQLVSAELIDAESTWQGRRAS